MANVILSTLTNTPLGTEMGSIEFRYTASIGGDYTIGNRDLLMGSGRL